MTIKTSFYQVVLICASLDFAEKAKKEIKDKLGYVTHIEELNNTVKRID